MKSDRVVTGISSNKTRITIAILTGVVFLAISLLFKGSGFNPLWLFPVAIIFLFTAILSLEKFLLITLFLVPLSIQLRFIFPGTPADLFLPTELMLPVILILLVFKILVSSELDREIISHPVSVILFCMLIWGLITTITSTMPVVSLKSLIARTWFAAGFYLLAVQLFKRRRYIFMYFIAYIAGMIPVIVFFIFRMWQSGLFNQQAAYSAVRPFFNDHTAIGASLAFCIPFIFLMWNIKDLSSPRRFILFLLLGLFLFALILSYSRAAWLSLVIAILFAAVLAWKISWKIILPVAVVTLILVIFSWSSIMMRLNENSKESSTEFSEHLQSIANITSDASNLERINRWKSAIRMSSEKPLLGWGPATYQFKYAPYQKASEKTKISTNWGEGGNAHSEYLSALVDSGIPGLILYVMLLAVLLYRGITLYYLIEDRLSAMILLSVITGLITYCVHGFLNNFLDTDKISALFWGMTGVIVALDIGFRNRSGAAGQ